MSTIAGTLAPPRYRTIDRRVYTVACVAAGSVFLALLAQVSIPLPFTPVPITGQTLGVLLVGAAYGPGMGAATIGLYLLWGVVGLPVFAPNPDGSHDTGIATLGLMAYTGGYLWGFVLAAVVTGRWSRRGWDRRLWSSVIGMLLGTVVIYAIGLPWLHEAFARNGLPITWAETLTKGFWPYVGGDLIKLAIAAGMLPATWKLLERLRPGAGDDGEA